ncbi:hypothetical protein HanRHA438_Chr09g0381111 [Helianthus annuus]|nr:hypothetical protein HanRHA438_Chr09g0381111 [Helianthus annuus]
MMVEGPTRHIFINQDLLLDIITIANERHQVTVAQLRKSINLSPKLKFPLVGDRIQPFDGYHMTSFFTGNLTFVNSSKSTLSNNQFSRKVFGCSLNFCKGKTATRVC